jgi:hypothetical protein
MVSRTVSDLYDQVLNVLNDKHDAVLLICERLAKEEHDKRSAAAKKRWQNPTYRLNQKISRLLKIENKGH